MAFEHYIRYGAGELRCGYTTGTCAALAAKAAAEWMLSGVCPPEASLVTPAGIEVTVPVEDPQRSGDSFCCAVRKDGGDDPDVTDGMLIYASVCAASEADVLIEGSTGIGRVTKPGLDRPVGEAAINTVPRRMIRENVLEICQKHGYPGGIRVIISAPDGERIAKQSFNEKLGIEGGISILGTSGIVRPMSEKALVDVMEAEAREAALSAERLILVPGNYGMHYLGELGLDKTKIPQIMYSGYFGEALDIAGACHFEEVLIVSHAGKLVKTAGGIMNTHQKNADCRMELFCAHAAVCGADTKTCRELMQAATTDACIGILDAASLREPVIGSLMQSIDRYMRERIRGAYRFGAVMFSNVYGILGMTSGTEDLLEKWRSG